LILKIAELTKSKVYSTEYKIRASEELQTMLQNGNKTFWNSNFNQSLKLYLNRKREETIKNLVQKAERFLMIDLYPELKSKFEIESRILDYFSKVEIKNPK
jgi:hypothetical protein